MKYTTNDVVKTTKILDVHEEYGILSGYHIWIENNRKAGVKSADQSLDRTPAADDDDRAVFWEALFQDKTCILTRWMCIAQLWC